MAIKDLTPRQGKVDLIVEVAEKGDVRTWNKFGTSGRVANAKVKDDSGQIVLTLWNDDIDKVNVGDKIHIINGYVGEWQGEMQLSTGKFGSLELVEKGSGKSAPSPAPVAKPETKSTPLKEEKKVSEKDLYGSDDENLAVEEENIDDLYDEEEN